MGLLDFLQGASNSAASNVSAPVDGLAWLLRKAGLPIPANPVGGSDWMAEKGLTAQPKNKNMGLLGEAIGGAGQVAAAAKAAAIAKGLLSLDDAAMDMTRRGLEGYMDSTGMRQNIVSGGKYAPALNQKFGDKLDAYLSDRDGVTTLSKIVVPKESRNSGIGSAFMKDLAQMADKDGVTLALSPSNDFGGSVKRLDKFYRSNGFVPNKGRFKDYEISETMLRPPGYQMPAPNPQTKTFSGDSEFFDAVGVNKQAVKADVDALMRKHPEFFANHANSADHVAHGLLGEPVLISEASDPRFILTAQEAGAMPVPGGEDAYRSLVTNFGGKQGYQVRSAQAMDEAQLTAKKLKAKK